MLPSKRAWPTVWERDRKLEPIPLVRARVVVPFVDFLDSAGAPVERLLEGVELSPRILEDPERVLPLHMCLSFYEHVARSEDLADLGLVVGLRTRFGELGAYSRLARGAPTLHQVLQRLIDGIALHNTGDRVWLGCDGKRALLWHRFTLPDAPGRRHGELFTVAMMIEAIRTVLGPRWMPDEVRLPQTEEPNRKRCEAMLGVPVVCGGRSQAVVFARALLAARPMASHTSPKRLEADYDLLQATSPADDFAGSVRQTIGTLLCDGYPDIHHVAEAVGLKERTMQRRLAQAGETYRRLVDSARLGIAIDLLTNSDARLTDIAAELAYEDQANFTRAFRRWTGMSPRAFRRSQRLFPREHAAFDRVSHHVPQIAPNVIERVPTHYQTKSA